MPMKWAIHVAMRVAKRQMAGSLVFVTILDDLDTVEKLFSQTNINGVRIVKIGFKMGEMWTDVAHLFSVTPVSSSKTNQNRKSHVRFIHTIPSGQQNAVSLDLKSPANAMPRKLEKGGTSLARRSRSDTT